MGQNAWKEKMTTYKYRNFSILDYQTRRKWYKVRLDIKARFLLGLGNN
jgi:hypothetical protein